MKHKIFKKSMSMGVMIGLITAVIIGIILFSPLTSFSKDLTSAFERETCKNSVFQQSLVKNLPSIVSGELHRGPNCQTYGITFFDDHVEQSVYRNGMIQTRNYEINIPSLKDDEFGELTSEIVNHVVAEELYWCWYQFLEGQSHIFMDNKWYSNDLGDDGLAGFVCTSFRFSFEDFPQKKSFTGFFDYLKFAEPPEETKTYYDTIINHTRVCEVYEDLLQTQNLHLSDTQKQAFADYMNQKYGYDLRGDRIYKDFSELPKDACWNFFIDGFPSFAPGNNNLYPKKPHPEIKRQITFETDKSYDIIMLRMGKDKEKETYFAYVVPSSVLPAMDQNYDLEYIE